MVQLITHYLKKIFTTKQRAAIGVILLTGIVLGGIILDWDEMMYNIMHHRIPSTPNKINVELCLQKSNFKQIGDEIEETLKGEICINSLNKGIKNRQTEYYANAQVCNQDSGVPIEIILTEDEYNTLEEGKHYFLVRKKYYNQDGWNIRTEDTIYKSEDEYWQSLSE